jgi:hypothetical protein
LSSYCRALSCSPWVRRGPPVRLDFVVGVRWRGNFPLVDVGDVPLEGFRTVGALCHEALARGMMAPPARVGVGDPLRISHEEIVEGFHDIVRHPDKLVIDGRRMHALRREVTDSPHSIAQTKWELYRGVLGEVCQGERFSLGKLHYHIGEREREVS